MARVYSNWIQAYCAHTRFSESPDSYHFWTAVATVAGTLRRRVWIDQRQFQWTPNFYIILVGPPGVAAKSTSLRIGLNLLEKVPGVHMGPQSATWQAIGEALLNAQEGVHCGGPEPEIMSCLNFGVAELGTFLRPDNKEFVDCLIAWWDGQKEVWRRETKTQGKIEIHNPWINLIACTTPSWLRENFPEAMIGGGLTSRMVFVYAEAKRQLVAYPSLLIDSGSYKKEEEQLFHDLLEIAKLAGEYQLSPEALKWGQAWYEKHWTSARTSHMASDRFAGYFARKQTHLHKLAMVLAASKRNTMVITAEDLSEANELVTNLEVDMQHVFSSIGMSAGARISNEILALVRNNKVIMLGDLWRQCMATMAQKDFNEALSGLVSAGFIKVKQLTEGRQLTFVPPKVINPDEP